MKLISNVLILFALCFFQFSYGQTDKPQYILYGVENFDDVKAKLELQAEQVEQVKQLLQKRDDRFYKEFIAVASPDLLETNRERILYKEALIRKKRELDHELARELNYLLSESQLTIYGEMMEESLHALNKLDFTKPAESEE